MAIKCDNCQQPLLAEDTVCWQCGHEVNGAAGSESLNVKEKWAETSSSGQVSALAVYGSLTVVLIVLALLVTVYLGRQPLVQAASQRPPEGWAYVTNLRRDFTVMLPDSWVLYDLDDSDGDEDTFSQLLASFPELTQATDPLGSKAEDHYVLFVAVAEPAAQSGEQEGAPEHYLVVAHSKLLNGLSSEEAIALAEAAAIDNDIELINAQYVDDFAKSHLALDARIPAETGELSCRQQFITGVAFSLIVAACGPDRALSGTILDSFERLAE